MKGDCFEIVGGKKLFGKITNQTSKNASLPIMSASLLVDCVALNEVPNITDVHNMIKILQGMNVETNFVAGKLIIDSSKATNLGMDESVTKTMRSSLFLLGPMLSRFKRAVITMPGGCKIGARPIDIHIDSLKKLNVKSIQIGEQFFFNAENARAGRIKLRLPSVGATENIVQFACNLKGKTTIFNAAREPEVVDLCNFLNKAGAKIFGAGTNKITIYGVDRLCNTQYTPIKDRIVSGTLMCAVAICGGKVTIENGCVEENKKIIEILRSIGCQIDTQNDIIHIVSNGNLTSFGKIATGYYPNFATDLQSFMLTVACFCKGKSTIVENVFENRFLTVAELLKMGAKIAIIDANTVEVNKSHLEANLELEAKDLRGGASLVLTCLGTKGKSIINNVHYFFITSDKRCCLLNK